MGAQKTVTVTKMGGGESKSVTWKEGMDAGAAVLAAGFSTEGVSLTVNSKAGDLETPVKPGDSVVAAAKVANG